MKYTILVLFLNGPWLHQGHGQDQEGSSREGASVTRCPHGGARLLGAVDLHWESIM